MHHLLARQWRRLYGYGDPPPTVEPLLDVVSGTYDQNDKDRALLEHSLETVSEELEERFRRLEAHRAQREELVAERQRAEELALLNAISIAGFSEPDLSSLMRRVLALVAPFCRAEAAEAWLPGPDGWQRRAAWPVDAPAAAVAPSSVPAAVAAAAQGEAFGAECVLAAPAGRPDVVLSFLGAAGGAQALAPDVSAALGQQVVAAMQHVATAQALHEGAELLRGVTRGTADVVLARDAHGRYVMANPAGVALFGRTEAEVLGRADAELLGADLAAVTRAEDAEVMRTGTAVSVERTLGVAGGRTYLVRKAPLRNPSGDIVGVVVVATDLTERKALEAQLLQSQKMEALGRLAGGIAHDFNNLLTVISGNLELTGAAADPMHPDFESLASAREAAGRAADLTSRLLAFGRRSILQPSVLGLNDLIRGLEPMVRRLIGEDIVVAIDLDPRVGCVRGDRSQFEQMVMNLIVNARDAMPNGGRLSVSTAPAGIGRVRAPGVWLRLSIADTGVGMNETTRTRIFEPFFTTKGPGRGTGLGLSMVYSAVQAIGGDIRVSSSEGKGSVFEIDLPECAEVEPPVKAAEAQPAAFGGNETLLLVEDEPTVRQYALRVLQRQGYHVLEAGNGTDALAVSRAHSEPIALLVSDVVMPGMGGAELTQILTAERPDMRVLLMSGYTDDEMLRAGIWRDQFRFLPKPFGSAQLLRAVRDALDAGGAARAVDKSA